MVKKPPAGEKGKPRGAKGRRPTGIRPGERLSDYKRLTMRLPADVHAELTAASGALHRPQWRVLIDAIRAYVGSGPSLSEEERRVLQSVLHLHRTRR